MVKNTTGGSKHKGLARKEVNGSRAKSILRTIREEGEMYAVIVKVLGGDRAAIVCMDNVERDCIIRGKFRGKKKRDNILRPGVLVLVGTREWASNAVGKKPVCDLLEVYGDADKERLKVKETALDWKFVNGIGDINTSTASTEELEFTDKVVSKDYTKMIEEEMGGGEKTIEMDFGHDDEIDINDI